MKSPISRDDSEKELIEAISLIEELQWFLSSIKSRKRISALRNYIEHSYSFDPLEIKNKNPNRLSISTEKIVSPNPNRHFLIGSLPKLLQNRDLFPTNIDIADFASQVLSIDIPRPEKRSRYELIGLIICEVDQISDAKLRRFVAALVKLLDSSEHVEKLVEQKKTGYFSWNETIRKLTNE